MKRCAVKLALILVCFIVLVGCASIKEMGNYAPPGRIVAISPFKCTCDPLIQETLQDTFIDVFFKQTTAKPIKGEEGEITIKGTITMDEGQTGSTKGSILGIGSSSLTTLGGGSSGSSASGTYMSGITVQAYKNGELIATYSFGQNLGRGVLLSPIIMATRAANYISTILVRQNEIGRRK
jgi:hypothetical protein